MVGATVATVVFWVGWEFGAASACSGLSGALELVAIVDEEVLYRIILE